MHTKFLLALGLSLWAVAGTAQEAASPAQESCGAEDLECLENTRQEAVDAMLMANSNLIRTLGLNNDDVVRAWAQGQQGWQKMNAFTCKAEGLIAKSEAVEILCRIRGTQERTATIEAYAAQVQ